MSFSRKSYKLTSDTEKSRVTGKGWQGGEDAFCSGGRRRKGQMQQGPRSIETWAFQYPLFLRLDLYQHPWRLTPSVVALLTLAAGQSRLAVCGNSTDHELL